MEEDHLILKPKRPKGEDGYKIFSVRISVRIKEETVSKLDELSAQTGRSRNELIGIFLDYAIQHCKVEE